MRSLRKFPNIDYAAHPAYGGLFGRPKLKDRLEALRRLWPHFIMQARVARKFQGNAPLPLEKVSPSGDPIFYALARDGVASFSLPQNLIDVLKNAARPFIDQLEAKKASLKPEERKFMDKTLFINKKTEEGRGLHDAAAKALGEYNILSLASRYRSGNVGILHINLMISDPSDLDWKNHFSDINLPDPKTAYFHMDSSIRKMRCLIYLTRVGPGNGPFGYILGSNLFRMSFLEFVTRKANDVSGLDKCDRETRRLFSALPKFLRKKSEFGNDLPDGSAESGALLASEKKFTSDVGNTLLFDSDGIHRGGMVEEGQRIMLQITLSVKK